MLFLLLGILVASCVILLLMRKTRTSVFLLGMTGSLAVQMTGIMIFIAKKGGFSHQILKMLFFSLEIRGAIRDLYLTLGSIGFTVAVGRYLFPLFLLRIALEYSAAGALRRRQWLKRAVYLPPLALLICYMPALYRRAAQNNTQVRDLLYWASLLFIASYLIIAFFLLEQEYRSLTIRFYRLDFGRILLFMISMSLIYLMYSPQDPGQIYRFYSYDYGWYSGLGYLMFAPGPVGYVMIVAVNVICMVLGVTSMFRYAQDSFADHHDEAVMQIKFDVARTGVAVFVHSIKNQLLANRILEKRIYSELDKGEIDAERIRESMDALRENNEMLLARTQELYASSRDRYVTLVPVRLKELEEETLRRVRHKYPQARIETSLSGGTMIMADVNYLSEALANILINAWEASEAAGRADRPVRLLEHDLRRNVMLEIRDEGCGIPEQEQKKIFEPFYSSKNSTKNWGMGLYHAKVIVKAHFGSVKVESRPGEGTSFFLSLPKHEG